MGWGKFDDAYPHHPKLLAAGAEGLALDVSAVCYANRYGTDGFVPEAMLPALYPPLKSPGRVAKKLVEVGRWEKVDGGWEIHDFLDYNPTAEKAADKSAKRAAAGSKGGKRSKPPSKQEANGEANASGDASDGGKQNAEQNGSPTRARGENPDPAPLTPSDEGGGQAAANGKPPYSERLAAWLRDERGCAIGTYSSLYALYEALLKNALAELDPGKHHNAAMGLLCEFVESVEGGAVRDVARARMGRLLKLYQPESVLHGVGESMDWGAGLSDEHRDKPDSWIDYVTAVVQKQERGAA